MKKKRISDASGFIVNGRINGNWKLALVVIFFAQLQMINVLKCGMLVKELILTHCKKKQKN